MAKNFYIFSSGQLRRRQNTLFLEDEKGKIPIPIEGVEQLFLFGEVTVNTKLLNFLAQKGIVLHVFNYYGFYSGSFYPKESLLSGTLIVKQVEYYLDERKRLSIAQKFVEAALHNMKRNLEKREGFEGEIDKIRDAMERASLAGNIGELMLAEAYGRRSYYNCWERITGWEFVERSMHPPANCLNSLISFANSMVYALVLKEIYMTALNPTISYLHEPRERRFSLALDVAEIFKPVLGDRTIFRVVDREQLKEEAFEEGPNFVYLSEKGRKIFIKELDQQLEKTVLHRGLRRRVKYKNLIRLELYKIIKHILGEKEYKPLKVWW